MKDFKTDTQHSLQYQQLHGEDGGMLLQKQQDARSGVHNRPENNNLDADLSDWVTGKYRLD